MPTETPRTGLLALVDELLLSIIDKIDSKDTLSCLAASCRHFQDFTEPYIWRSLLVTCGDHARLIATALDSRDTRSSYIQELSIRNFDAQITHADISDTRRRSTPLVSLTLIECNVNVNFLDVVLSLPKALKELDIGERLHAFEGCMPSSDITTRTSQPTFIDALARQADSLERLSHISGATNLITQPDPDSHGVHALRDLEKLTYLSLDIESTLLPHLERDDYPSSLKTLRVTDVSWSSLHQRRYHRAFNHSGRLLHHCNHILQQMSHPVDLEVHFANGHYDAIIDAAPASLIADIVLPIYNRSARAPLYPLSSYLLSQNRNLRLTASKFTTGKSYIPPYMLGEEVPFEEEIYTSNDYWRICGINFRVMDDDEFRREVNKKPRMKCEPCRAKRGWECFNAGDGSVCIYCENRNHSHCVYPELG
ncbi:hypothetical protein N0V90_004646 [Kalmusia sp. IMI 367209]|nr:hypothetical protein N0V90_004646 [Kalmusia sp. IMI 367209]